MAKCFKCACDHQHDCECECTYHLAHRCPGKEKPKVDKADLGLFMQANVETFLVRDDEKDDELVLFIEDAPSAATEVNRLISAPASASVMTSTPASTPVMTSAPVSTLVITSIPTSTAVIPVLLYLPL